jgi:hypothetical protein
MLFKDPHPHSCSLARRAEIAVTDFAGSDVLPFESSVAKNSDIGASEWDREPGFISWAYEGNFKDQIVSKLQSRPIALGQFVLH